VNVIAYYYQYCLPKIFYGSRLNFRVQKLSRIPLQSDCRVVLFTDATRLPCTRNGIAFLEYKRSYSQRKQCQ
jgi:hypothetical protein